MAAITYPFLIISKHCRNIVFLIGLTFFQTTLVPGTVKIMLHTVTESQWYLVLKSLQSPFSFLLRNLQAVLQKILSTSSAVALFKNFSGGFEDICILSLGYFFTTSSLTKCKMILSSFCLVCEQNRPQKHTKTQKIRPEGNASLFPSGLHYT